MLCSIVNMLTKYVNNVIVFNKYSEEELQLQSGVEKFKFEKRKREALPYIERINQLKKWRQ